MSTLKFKMRMNRALAEALCQVVDKLMLQDTEDDAEGLLLLALWEVRCVIGKKLNGMKLSFSVTLSGVQAQALRVLYLDYYLTPRPPLPGERGRNAAVNSDYLGMNLHQISLEVHRQFFSTRKTKIT